MRKSDNLLILLSEGDLRSVGNNKLIISKIHSQKQFDELFNLIFHHDRKVVMRVADAVEKITQISPNYLLTHKKEIIELIHRAKEKELKWHLAQFIPRIPLNKKELDLIWKILFRWAEDNDESNIVRVNSIESLFHLAEINRDYKNQFEDLLSQLKRCKIPSILARIKKLSKK